MHSGLERPIRCLKRIEKNYEYLIQKNDKPLIGSKAATWVIIGASSQSTLKYAWHFHKAPHKPGHLGSPASAIQGCCLGNEWASLTQLSLSALGRPLSMAECCLQGDDSPSLQPSGGQWELGFLAETGEYSRSVLHIPRDQLWGPLPLGQPLGWLGNVACGFPWHRTPLIENNPCCVHGYKRVQTCEFRGGRTSLGPCFASWEFPGANVKSKPTSLSNQQR